MHEPCCCAFVPPLSRIIFEVKTNEQVFHRLVCSIHYLEGTLAMVVESTYWNIQCRKRNRDHDSSSTSSLFGTSSSSSLHHNLELYAVFVPPRRFLRKRRCIRPSVDPAPSPPTPTSPPSLPRTSDLDMPGMLPKAEALFPAPGGDYTKGRGAKSRCDGPKQSPRRIMRALLACMKRTESSRSKLFLHRKSFSKKLLEMSDKILHRNTTRKKLIRLTEDALRGGPRHRKDYGSVVAGGRGSSSCSRSAAAAAATTTTTVGGDEESLSTLNTSAEDHASSSSLYINTVSPHTSPEPTRPAVSPFVPPSSPSKPPSARQTPRPPSSSSSSSSSSTYNSTKEHSPYRSVAYSSSHVPNNNNNRAFSPGRVVFASHDSPGRHSVLCGESTTSSPGRVSEHSSFGRNYYHDNDGHPESPKNDVPRSFYTHSI